MLSRVSRCHLFSDLFFLRTYSSDFAVRYQFHPLEWTFARGAAGKGPSKIRALILLTLYAQENRNPSLQNTNKTRSINPSRSTRVFRRHFLCVFGSLDFYCRHEFLVAVLIDGSRCVEELFK